MKLLTTIFSVFLTIVAYSQVPTISQVYQSNRLRILHDSITITGRVIAVHKEFDGDYHIDIKSDSFIIVAEVVCAHWAPKIFSCACVGYVNTISIPGVGQNISVTGPYVWDKRHRIREIHPVQRLIIYN